VGEKTWERAIKYEELINKDSNNDDVAKPCGREDGNDRYEGSTNKDSNDNDNGAKH
jgi:hypothetical protein